MMSNRHVMRRPFGGGDAAFIINLGGGDVAADDKTRIA
jgi:hypothetical protein